MEDSVQIPPETLIRFWEVCSTATVTVTKKVAFVELRAHTRAPREPTHPATELRELMRRYLSKLGTIQHQDRAPVPMVRDIRNTLTNMGYGGKGKGKGKA